MSQCSGNISSGNAWAPARLQRAICWVFTIHHLPGAGQEHRYKQGCCYHCHAAGVGLGLGLLPWSQDGPLVAMAQAAYGFIPQAGAGLSVGAHATPPHGQEPPGHCSPTACLLLSTGSPAAFFLRNQFLFLTAMLRKPSKTAKHGMQNKIQSEGLNYSRTENTQLIKSARHSPCFCAGPKAPLCLRVLLCSGLCWVWGGGRAELQTNLPQAQSCLSTSRKAIAPPTPLV